MKKGALVYSPEYGAITVTRKHYSASKNKFVWYAKDEQGKERALTGDEQEYKKIIEKEEKKKKKQKEKEDEDNKYFSNIKNSFDKALENGVELKSGVKIENFEQLADFLSFEFPESFKIENPDDIAKFIKIPKNEFPKSFSISNISDIAKYIEIPEFPKEIKISNFPKTEKVVFPESISKLSFDKTEKSLAGISKQIAKVEKDGLRVSNSQDEAIPVRMVDASKQPEFKFNKDGRLEVEVDRIGLSGGSGGLSVVDSENLASVKENQTSGLQRTQITASNTPMFDAFGRLRTSSPHTLFDIQNEYGATTLFIERSLAGGGNATHDNNSSTTILSVGTTAGDSAVGHTRQYFRYSPGKSQLIYFTRVFNAPKTNLVQECGYGDTRNGYFFQVNGNGIGVVQRSSVSGSPVDIRIAQSSFNIDKLDGTGASGFTLDITKANIYWIDFEALYAGGVRFGVVGGDRTPIVCHEIQNVNTYNVPYIQTANLPVRVALYNTGTTSSPSQMTVICTAVMCEDGDQEQVGVNHTASNGTSLVGVTTRRPILSIKPSLTFQSKVNRSLIEAIQVALIAKTNDCHFEIVYNGTLTGASFANIDATSSTMMKDTSATSITGGIVVFSGNIVAGSGSTSTSSGIINILSKLPLVVSLDGTTSIPLTVVCTSFSSTSNVSATLNWQEVF